jgi:hypothetical protein
MAVPMSMNHRTRRPRKESPYESKQHNHQLTPIPDKASLLELVQL